MLSICFKHNAILTDESEKALPFSPCHTGTTFKSPPVCMTLALFRTRPSVHDSYNNKAQFHGRWLPTKRARFITGNRPISGCCMLSIHGGFLWVIKRQFTVCGFLFSGRSTLTKGMHAYVFRAFIVKVNFTSH